MAIRGPRLEFSVGAFLLLALASLMVLAVASTNQRWSWGSQGYELKARFSQVGQLRKQAPVKIGGVTVGQVASIDLDPVKFESIVTLRMDSKV
ncbi:MlaD family protein, partial [Klebsiella pneumoniae]